MAPSKKRVVRRRTKYTKKSSTQTQTKTGTEVKPPKPKTSKMRPLPIPVNPDLMVPVMRFQCLRCGYDVNAVWSPDRQAEVYDNGGIPCRVCDEKKQVKKGKKR